MSIKIKDEETKKDLRNEIQRLKRNKRIERGLILVGFSIAGVIISMSIKKGFALKVELEDARNLIDAQDIEIQWFKDQFGWID